MMRKLHIMLVAAWCFANVPYAAALADQPVAEGTCKRPELRDRLSVPPEDLEVLQSSVEAYVKCMQPVIEANRAKAQTMLAQAKVAAEASNADVTALNELIAQYKAFALKHKDDK